MNQIIIFCFIITSLVLQQEVQAGLIFSDSFDGPLNSNLEDVDNAFTLDGAASRTSSSSSSDRHYIRTIATDFNAIDFVAELSFSLSNASGLNNIHFFGLGSGTPDSSYFNEAGDSIFFRIHALDDPNPPFRGRVLVGSNVNGTGGIETSFDVGTISTADSVHRARIEKLGNSLTFSIDESFSGSFASDMQLTISDLSSTSPFLGNANSRLFFGTALTIDEFDDFSVSQVVPEPSSIIIFSVSSLIGGVVYRRRKIYRVNSSL